MTPQEFVTKVYNVQEGVILDDLWPIDDKYKECLYQANLVIDEFMHQADWSFLREAIILGTTNPIKGHRDEIPKFILPDRVDRISKLFHDSIKLHPNKGSLHIHCDGERHYHIMEDKFIEVPFVSKGYTPKRGFREYLPKLCARNYGNYIEFTRRPMGHELNKVVVCDCQLKIPHLHICNDDCKDKDGNYCYYTDDTLTTEREVPLKCKHIEDDIFDPFYEMYIIYKTAYDMAKYSPIAGGIRGELLDTAQKELSRLRGIDASKTRPDIVKKKNNLRIWQVR